VPRRGEKKRRKGSKTTRCKQDREIKVDETGRSIQWLVSSSIVELNIKRNDPNYIERPYSRITKF
jgi:hypothetical protein